MIIQNHNLNLYYVVSSTTAINFQAAPMKIYCVKSHEERVSNPDLH